MKKLLFILISGGLIYNSNQVLAQGQPVKQKADTTVHFPDEKHLTNIRQLTFGGDNAEAYFSFDSKSIVFQMTNPDFNAPCDQIFASTLQKFNPKMVSTGMGRTTCSYFLPGDSLMLYASTHLGSKDCPPKPAPRADHKYVWPLYSTFDIFVADKNGKVVNQLTKDDGYDAEATVSPKGDLIVFTSTRSGDLELYTMNIDGSNVKQVTKELGYDGGAFFSPDGKKLIFRASRPKTEEDVKTYKDLLAQGLVMPTNMELYTCNIDGSDLKQVTNLGSANWAPFFTPDGKKVIFSSNHKQKGYHFNLWMCKLDGSELEQISFDPTFDAFPVFSPDGKHLIFSSNRNNGGGHDTNLFYAEWKD
ncbi:MAG: PD40 domain-containing protein [Bacteroidetes bacterium]|nr:PD40 domain-containing protein [Bacteroidota bacterium]MBL0032429.1 PD40 domain-containing protein [Bacteroidota bacterium]MBP6425958.1 PD40 domain-containing protein [Bacteroidia bacterium]